MRRALSSLTWGRLLGILAGVALLAGLIWVVVTVSSTIGTQRASANGETAPNAAAEPAPTSSPTAPAEAEAGESYPAAATPTEEAIAQVATATLEPSPTATTVPPTPTSEPTATTAPPTPVPTLEPVDQDELYASQLAQLAEEPKQNRGESPSKGVTLTVPANSVALLFAGHADVEMNGQVVKVNWQNATENVITVSNSSGSPADFLIKGFPETGYTSWIYNPGVSPEARKLAALTVGNPTHCGLSAGCKQAVVWNVVWDGTTLSYTQEIMKEEFDLTLAAAPIPTVDWNTLGASEGLFTMRKLLGQPASTISVNDISEPVEFGVTAGKDHLLALPAGSRLIGPDGTSQDFAEAATVILTNEESDTAVYVVWLSAPGVIGHEEYRYTFDVTATVPVLLKAQTEQPSAMRLLAAPTAPAVFVFSFDGTTTVEEKK